MDSINHEAEACEHNPCTCTDDQDRNNNFKEESCTLDQQPNTPENTSGAITAAIISPLKAEQVPPESSPKNPTFSGRGSHPLRFLEALKIYLTVMIISPNNLGPVLECLTGNAKNWARIYVDKWQTFDQFESDFLEQYWGRGVRATIRQKIVTGCWNMYRDKSMTEYFAHWYCQAKDLMCYSCEEDIVFDLIQHFPPEIRRMWVVSNITTAEATMKFLRKIEETDEHFAGMIRQGRKRMWNTGAPIWNYRNPHGRRNQPGGGKRFY